MPDLVIRGLDAHYGATPVLSGLDLHVESGATVGLIGPSGSGKSTILRTILGLLPPSRGEIVLDGRRVDYAKPAEVRALRERVAVVFQQYNLFQNMTVLQNVCITPVKIRGRPRREVEDEARRLLAKVGLADKLSSYPDQLSGGQQQRVAIARALALRPEILLLDEVTAALDPELVSEVLDTIRLLAREGMTMMIVSHEMGFIREVSSRVVFMADGRKVEEGPPARIFDAPQEARTQSFVSKILRH
ncbi:amino acid ABC transporter ATP-binding protein [Methylobacterium terricola]|uniref:Amino acid ABC transporter ATP-binding protein n=1 Tax=Methylobacterium terricola TaxID=2583531 RepID=A0A5C4LAX8_9HYPH|nr:amino acid ABC transporter ATP-binding protein [Methylobacterium terricola]TNC10041.1 amino acid ABC transporter ATP-binding protein [Methylobacterium terricola]